MKWPDQIKKYWQNYLSCAVDVPQNPKVEFSIAGNDEIADQLLDLYLSGKKRAGSSLLKGYQYSDFSIPEIGNYWIILNGQKEPKCIAKTIQIETYQFDQVPEKVAIAEGEGDLSLDYWRKAHINFFTPFLKNWKINDLEKEQIIVEYYEVVFK